MTKHATREQIRDAWGLLRLISADTSYLKTRLTRVEEAARIVHEVSGTAAFRDVADACALLRGFYVADSAKR